MYVCMYVCTCTYVHVCMYVRTRMYVHVCMSVIPACMYVCKDRDSAFGYGNLFDDIVIPRQICLKGIVVASVCPSIRLSVRMSMLDNA